VIYIKKTALTSSDYNTILDIYENAECYDKTEFEDIILDQFECETIEEDRLEDSKCPKCGQDLELQLDGQESYEYQGFNEHRNTYSRVCNSCNWSE
jgi:hypothetical protein